MRDPAVRYWFSCHLLLLRKLIVKYGKNGVFVWFQNGKFWKRFIQPSLIVFYQRRSEISIIWLLAGIIENFKNSVHNISCILIDILLIWFDYRQQSCIRILLSFDWILYIIIVRWGAPPNSWIKNRLASTRTPWCHIISPVIIRCTLV